MSIAPEMELLLSLPEQNTDPDWNFARGVGNWNFIGIENFKSLFADKWFTDALKNTLLITLVTVPIGSAIMHFDYSCDAVIGIGSGVINDIGKILAHATGRTYIIVGTAPSMDGFASATSSMERDGLKVSLDSTFAWAIVGDTDILREAPMHMLRAGVGDMLAKYISLAEWRIANILVGEYYCPVVAALVENALNRVVAAAPDLMKRDEEAVKAVMEGMVIAGMAMKYAGLSRPA